MKKKRQSWKELNVHQNTGTHSIQFESYAFLVGLKSYWIKFYETKILTPSWTLNNALPKVLLSRWFSFSCLVDVLVSLEGICMGSLPFQTTVDTQNSRVTSPNKQTLEIHREVDVWSPQTLGHPHRIHGTNHGFTYWFTVKKSSQCIGKYTSPMAPMGFIFWADIWSKPAPTSSLALSPFQAPRWHICGSVKWATIGKQPSNSSKVIVK